jgi:hypothetical protein
MKSRLLWPAKLQHSFTMAVAHQISRDRRHRRTVGRQVLSHKQSTSVNEYVCIRREKPDRSVEEVAGHTSVAF